MGGLPPDNKLSQGKVNIRWQLVGGFEPNFCPATLVFASI